MEYCQDTEGSLVDNTKDSLPSSSLHWKQIINKKLKKMCNAISDRVGCSEENKSGSKDKG